MKLLPTAEQITSDLNDIKLRIAKMNARRNAQINLLQKKIMGVPPRSKYYPRSRAEYFRRLYYNDPVFYPFEGYPWRSSSLDSLELDKYYDSPNVNSKFSVRDLDDELFNKYKRLVKEHPSNTDLLSKLKDFVFEQERQMTTDLLHKISADRKLRSGIRLNPSSRPNRESNSLSRAYDPPPMNNDPPFLNPINKKDNFYKRYNALIKKILRPLRKSSPPKYESPKIQSTPIRSTLDPVKTNYISKSYLDDYYYPTTQFYRPYWYRYSLSPFYRRYVNDYEYLPKLQPASVPLDVESIIRKSNNGDRINFKSPTKYDFMAPSSYKYDPFESDSYLRSSLPTWKQYYYTQKLKSKPSNESFLDYYDPYYDFFPDRASVDSTDDLLTQGDTPKELSDHANQLVDEYRDAIYEDIIQNLRQKQLKKRQKLNLQPDRVLFGYRVRDQEKEDYSSSNYFDEDRHKNLYRTTKDQSTDSVYKNIADTNPLRKYPTFSYYPKGDNFSVSKEYTKNTTLNEEIPENSKVENTVTGMNTNAGTRSKADKNDENKSSNNYETKIDDDRHFRMSSTNENRTDQRQNVVSPSIFHTKCATPVDNSLNRFSLENVSPTKTKNTIWSAENKIVPKNMIEYNKHEKKLANSSYGKIISPITSYEEVENKYDTSPITLYEEVESKYDTEPWHTGEYTTTDALPNRLATLEGGNTESDKFQNSSTKQQLDYFQPINIPTKSRSSTVYSRKSSGYLAGNENAESLNNTIDDRNTYQKNNKQLEFDEYSQNAIVPDNKHDRLPFDDNSTGIRNYDLTKKYTTEVTPQKHPNSPTGKKQMPVSTIDSGDDKHWVEDRSQESRREKSIDHSLQENIRRQSVSKSRQPTPTTDRTPLSRRNSVIFENNKSSPKQSASRRNSIKPTLQRKNSIQPALAEKRNLLQKMNFDANYDDGYEQQPENTNDKSGESYSIEEQNETNDEVTYQSDTQPQSLDHSSKEEVFLNVDKEARKSLDANKDDAFAVNDNQLIHNYDFNPNEVETRSVNDPEKASLPVESNYFNENPSTYDENGKDSFGRDDYNTRTQQFYPEYDYNEVAKYDDPKPQNYYPEKTYSGDPSYSSFNNYPNNYPTAENYSNNYTQYYNSNQPPTSNYMPQEYVNPQYQYSQLPQPGYFDNYAPQENVSYVNQETLENYPQQSFQHVEENPMPAEKRQPETNQNSVRNRESAGEEQISLNFTNEKSKDKPNENIETNSANIRQPSVEKKSSATNLVKAKQSIDLGKSSTPPAKELSRRTSRSTLLSQSSDDKKFRNQSSAGELQKRLSKPKITENKLRRTASTIKSKPITKKS